MKKIAYIFSLLALLVGSVSLSAQESKQFAIYNYRNDGDFSAFLNIDVDSITYSCFDLDSVEHEDIVIQEVWTPDSVYRIPIEVIDSIGFRAPEPEFKEGVFHITAGHIPYAIDVDDLTVAFDSSIPSSMLPAIGQIMISDVYDDPFEDGFAGRVESIDYLEGKYVIQCSEVKITDIFSKLVLVGKGVSVNDDEPATEVKRQSWWEDPAFTVEGQGIYSVKLPTTLDLTLLSGVCSVKSKNPELTISYYLYLDDVIYSFSADAYLNHKDLSFQIAFKLSDFLKIGNTVSEHMTNFILGKGDEEKVEEKWYEHEFDDIKLKVPFQAGPVNFTLELAPIFKLEGDVEVDVINKTSARQHIGFKSSGYTATLLASPFLSLALSDLNYNYVQDPTRVQQLTMKAEGSATMGISLQLKANVISKKLLHAAIGAEYDRKASATLQFNLYDTENPISGLYDVIKDSKVKVEDYVKIKGEIGVSPLKILTLKGSFKIPIKTWGEYYMVPHFSKPELPPYENNPWNFTKPLSLYSDVSKDILLGCKPGLRIEDCNGRYVKQYTSTDEYQYEAAWAHTPLEIDISDLTPNKTYRCYPTFSMLGLDPFVVTPYNEFTIPQNLSVSPQSISMPVGMEYIIEIRDGWDSFAVVMEEGEDVVSIIQDEETDARHIKIKGEKEGDASLKIEDKRSGQVVHVPITITYAMTLVTSITLNQSTMSLKVGDTQGLFATVLPEDADNKTVAWKSSDEGVATVSGDGHVTAVAKGNCVITCSAMDGSGMKAECQVTVTADDTPTTDAVAVDLGLPSGTKWADRNVGASKPEDYGGYYAWGETEEKEVYNWSTYIHCDGSEGTCHDIGTDIAGTQYDVAHVKWGGSWKMPTLDLVRELLDNCTSEWTTVNGVNGRKFTGPNGNSIFLPAAGDRGSSGLHGAGSYGYYWSSSLCEGVLYGAYYLGFNSGGASWYSYGNLSYRSRGYSVRPVISGTITPDLTLSNYALILPGTGTAKRRVEITSGSGDYTITIDNPSIITAILSGSYIYITRKSVGTATITVTDTQSGQTATIAVTVTGGDNPTTDAVAVDLGLPSGTKWADRNVGASKPEDYGGYYAWGETEEKDVYDWSTYIHCDGTKESCHDIGSDIAGTKYDVAHVKWGGSWKMPTLDLVRELLDNCTSEWTTVNGVNGRKFTGPNGNSIFLPAAGLRWGGELVDAGSYGYYWSSTLYESYPSRACYLGFYAGGAYWSGIGYNGRGYGRSVRPVR